VTALVEQSIEARARYNKDFGMKESLKCRCIHTALWHQKYHEQADYVEHDWEQKHHVKMEVFWIPMTIDEVIIGGYCRYDRHRKI
jgi:hypothetical protein